jgi:hypothetical protein
VKLLAVVLATVVIVLIPLAHGSPIDPSTPGFWDAGDYDDVIIFLTSHLHLIQPDDVPAPSMSEAIARDVLEEPQRAIAYRSYELGSPRAPPTA